MDQLKIQSVQKQHVAAIGRLADVTDLFPSEMLGDMIAGYFDKTKIDIWFVGTLNGEVVAFGFCEPERMTEGTWNLLAIAVQPEMQGKRIGQQMMHYLEQRLADAGERILIVETMGTAELTLTREFYVKNGYAEEARIREFYEAGADKIIFWKKISV